MVVGSQDVATSQQRTDLEEQQLIEKHIDLDFDKYPYGRAGAWLRDSGASIWAIVVSLDTYNGDRDEVAEHLGISQEEIDAALTYYRRYKKYIDARIVLDEA